MSLTDLLSHVDHSSSSTGYLDRLVSLPLDDLYREPHAILSETATVEAELTNLCYREYATFTAVHQCSAAVDSAFDAFGTSLEDLLGAVPALQDACVHFTQSTSAVQSSRQRATLVQEHQNKVAELLELPQLVETCVRNGFYQEAMELAAHARMLARHANALAMDVAEEVGQVEQIMVMQLLGLLREPVKLPTLVKAVGYLKRMDVEDLGLAFLSSRLYNYRSRLATLERTDPVRYVRRYIDHFREHVYDIISQYSAIFDASRHLVSFASQAVEDLVRVIEECVPTIDSASLSSVLVQLAYCALSFARVGLDFGLQITDPFLRATEAGYAQAVFLASRELAEQLNRYSPDPAATTIAGFSPLAAFYNSHISALNALRLLAPVQARTSLSVLQKDSLDAASTAILQYLQRSTAPMSSAPSSPKSQLLRRNTETQLAPEVLAAKRRETRRACLTMARVWLDNVPVLTDGLASIYEGKGDFEARAIEEWMEDHMEEGVRMPDVYGQHKQPMAAGFV